MLLISNFVLSVILVLICAPVVLAADRIFEAEPYRIIIDLEKYIFTLSLFPPKTSKIPVCEVHNGSKIHVFGAGEPDKYEQATHLEFYANSSAGLEKLNIPLGLSEKILQYLKLCGENRRIYSDCAHFAHFVSDITRESIWDDVYLKNWVVIDSKSSPEPGETIIIGHRCQNSFINEMQTVRDPKLKDFMGEHFALYLDRGLYIQKAGSDLPMVITDLDEILKAYEREHVSPIFFRLKKK